MSNIVELSADFFKKAADEKNNKLIEEELYFIYNKIADTAQNGEYLVVLHVEADSKISRHMTEIIQYLSDKKFRASYNPDSYNLTVSW